MANQENLFRRFEAAFGRPLNVVWTDNHSVYLSLRPPTSGAIWTLRLHRSFGAAPDAVLAALRDFLQTRQRHHLGPAREFFVANRPKRASADRAPILRPTGRHHHVGRILARVCGIPLFERLPPVAVTWGLNRKPGRRCVRLGTYRQAEPTRPEMPAVIRVHRVLDSSKVPEVVVASVLHHEMVHHLLTIRRGPDAGRRHGPEFRRFEELFPGCEASERWIERELPRLL